MKTPDLSDARSRRRMIAVSAALVAVLVLAGIGVYGLITGPPTSTEPGSDDSSGTGPVVTVPSEPGARHDPPPACGAARSGP